MNTSRHGRLRLQRKGRERVSMLLKLLIEGQSVERKGGKGEGASWRVVADIKWDKTCANIS